MMYRNNDLKGILETREWKQSASGDDIAILNFNKSKKKKIGAILDRKLIVETSSESTFVKFIAQRSRWAEKRSSI